MRDLLAPVGSPVAVALLDGYVVNALAGPDLQPFWAQAYGSVIRRVRDAHRLAGEAPPTIDSIAWLVCRPEALAALVARGVGARRAADPDCVDLARWHSRDWLALDAGLRSAIATGLTAAAAAPAASGLRRVEGCAVPAGPAVDGAQRLETETVAFGAWTGEGPRWPGLLVEPAVLAGLRLGFAAFDPLPDPAAPSAPAVSSPRRPPHGYRAAYRLTDELGRSVARVRRCVRDALPAWCRERKPSS